ncbi:MAG: hypothetical protein ACPG6V_06375, partial [Flavobacteriales bacterium]
MTFAQEGYDWKEPVFMENNAGNEAPNYSILDNEGNVYISGLFKDEISIVDTVLFSDNLEIGIYLSKYDNNHNHLWSRLVLESTEEDLNQSVSIEKIKLKVDSLNNIYSIITYTDSINIEGELFTVDQSLLVFGDNVIVQMNDSGDVIKLDHVKGNCKTFINNLFIGNDVYYLIQLDKHGLETEESCICNVNNDTTVFDLDKKLLLTKMSNISDSIKWIKEIGASGTHLFGEIQVNKNSIYIVGNVNSSSNLKYDNDILNVPSAYSRYVFIMKLDLAGNRKWWKYASVSGWDSFLSESNLNLNTENDIVLTLNHFSQSTFNQIHFSDFSSLQGFGNNDRSFAVVNYDSLGNIKWKDMSDSRGYET